VDDSAIATASLLLLAADDDAGSTVFSNAVAAERLVEGEEGEEGEEDDKGPPTSIREGWNG